MFRGLAKCGCPIYDEGVMHNADCGNNRRSPERREEPKPDLPALVREIEQNLGITLTVLNRLPVPRPDVTGLGFLDEVTAEQIASVRRYIERRGWQFSRQSPEIATKRVEWVYVGEIQLVQTNTAYHATWRASVESIRREGLLPSTPERQTTENRHDCEGNIYLCEQLGALADADIPNAKTAHWWRCELSQKNRFGDPDWVILQVEIGKVEGARCYRDMWSESGIIVDSIHLIPPEVISQVFP